MIEVKNLVKKYGSRTALDHLSFTLKENQIYGFLGPNGAGKSTTMNILTGYIGADSGEVLIHGHNILEEPEDAKKSIGYLPEIPPLYPEMTVWEYLSFAAELKHIPKKQRTKEIQKVCSLLKIEDISHRLIRNLSKGYKQRTGLASAVLGFPEIIILDEPTVGLDPKQIIEIRQFIRTLAKEHTVILSSHILAEVQEICDYILIISNGALAASGTPGHLEELAHGKESIELTIKADRSKILSVLKNISNLHRITWKHESEDSCDILIDTSTDVQRVCENISLAFAHQGIPITHLSISKTTLEDVFLELTKTVPQPKKGVKKHDRNL